MSLQRRLFLCLLVCAPLVWGAALYFSITRARHEVNELFDTELVRLARQVEAMLGPSDTDVQAILPPAPAEGGSDAGESDVDDLAIAIWDRQGRLVRSDREGVQLPHAATASGFVDRTIAGNGWRIYYTTSSDGRWLVAAGQKSYERDELVYGLTISQVTPWLLVLPVLLATMVWAVRQALAPMTRLTTELQHRRADDLRPVPGERAPAELRPLLAAMNGLFARIEQMLLRERRFTADAAHELRTPLAVLRAQWDVVQRSASPQERSQAEAKLSIGIDRMARLVTQMLALSRVESGPSPVLTDEVHWPEVVEQAMSDCLALAERRRIELACEWPLEGRHPLPLIGDENLLVVLLRNLLDNAVRYAPADSSVTLRIDRDHLEVENEGSPLSGEQLARVGERFYRPDGQREGGSGLGVSIVRRIAELHGLDVSYGTGAGGKGVKVTLQFDSTARR